MVVQALLVASALLGLGRPSVDALDAHRRAIDATLAGLTPFGRWMTELWYNARPMLLEVGVPALLMGCSFPLANALIQRTERAVGSRAGALYLANTAGAVCGSLAPGSAAAAVRHAGQRDGAGARRRAGDRAAVPRRRAQTEASATTSVDDHVGSPC